MGEMKRLRHDARDDRQRVDARIEHAETTRLPDPGLPRMPVTNIFLPRNRSALDLALGKQCSRRFDACGTAGVPCGKQAQAFRLGQLFQRKHFRQCSARRLFQHHMLAGLDSGLGLGEASLRRRAERDRI
ncbi:hypothetical protein D3C87_1600490 [compost metagenome]